MVRVYHLTPADLQKIVIEGIGYHCPHLFEIEFAIVEQSDGHAALIKVSDKNTPAPAELYTPEDDPRG